MFNKYLPVFFILFFILPGCCDTKVSLKESSNISISKCETFSQLYTIDKIYKSMLGPQSTKEIYLTGGKEAPAELLWITGYSAVMVGPDGQEPKPQDFMCHSNLDFNNVSTYRDLVHWSHFPSHRLFTLSQGQLEVKFPQGFGIPMLSNQPFSLTTQVLNLNLKNGVEDRKSVV